MSITFSKVTVAGGGVLGAQIAYQAAYKGFDVTVWLRSDASIERTKPKIQRLHSIYTATLEALKKGPDAYAAGLCDKSNIGNETALNELKKAADKAANLHLTTDLNEAFSDADLVIESISENPEAKTAFYESIRDILPERTIIVTNTSTLMPSMFAETTGRPEKYLSLHFANNIWMQNMAEVMKHEGTDKNVFKTVATFAEEIGMVPLCLYKEQPGYLLNSMLVPFLTAAQHLLANEISDFASIDKAWKLGTDAQYGPFEIMDMVGLDTVYAITKMHPGADDPTTPTGKTAKILEQYLAEGRTGVNAGKGFYDYTA